MVHGWTDMEPLLPRFSCPAPHQSTHRAQGCVHQTTAHIPHPTKSPVCWAKFLHIRLPISSYWLFLWLPLGFLDCSALWERVETSEERAGMAGDGYFSTGRGEKTVAWVLYAKGKMKAVVDMVSIAGKEGSIQPSMSVSTRISHTQQLKCLQDLRKDLVFTCLCMCSSRVCAYY